MDLAEPASTAQHHWILVTNWRFCALCLRTQRAHEFLDGQPCRGKRRPQMLTVAVPSAVRLMRGECRAHNANMVSDQWADCLHHARIATARLGLPIVVEIFFAGPLSVDRARQAYAFRFAKRPFCHRVVRSGAAKFRGTGSALSARPCWRRCCPPGPWRGRRSRSSGRRGAAAS
jgi:hypothetical protein